MTVTRTFRDGSLKQKIPLVHRFSHFDTNMTSFEAWTRDTIAVLVPGSFCLVHYNKQASIFFTKISSSDQVFVFQ